MALSPKHQEFINQYIACYFNATEAYSRVYPNATRETARRNGHELLTNTDIAAEVQQRLAELIMGPDEVMTRFSEQARAEYSQYFLPNGTVDLPKLIRDGKAHLIKSVKETKYGTNVEFYDAHSAKELIGKHHGLFDNSPTGTEANPFHIKHIREVRSQSGVETNDDATE